MKSGAVLVLFILFLIFSNRGGVDDTVYAYDPDDKGSSKPVGLAPASAAMRR